ncbi:MAG TPA: hypothetical protein VEC11_01285 [Allosphingosinicella sp.]|nr:hypothetical protein [Allosphingosinicella sp.]
MPAMFSLSFVEQPQQVFGFAGGRSVRVKSGDDFLLAEDMSLSLGNVSVRHIKVGPGVVGHGAS